jgi:hypothetical protein
MKWRFLKTFSEIEKYEYFKSQILEISFIIDVGFYAVLNLHYIQY